MVSSYVFFSLVSILTSLHCWCVSMLLADIYMCEPSLHWQPAAAPGVSCILVLSGAVPCVCRSHPGSFRFTVCFLSPTDNFFTPHQRRLSPAERHLSALSCPPLIFPSRLCLFFPFPSYVFVFNSIASHLLHLCTTKKNKHPFFCADCISLLCPVFTFSDFCLLFQSLFLLNH